MITIIPIEPLSDKHAFLIIEAFNKLFIDRGGKEDGFGCGNGHGNGFGDGNGYGYGKCPEEWLIDEISKQPTGG